MRQLLERLEEGKAEFQQALAAFDGKHWYDRPHVDFVPKSATKKKIGNPDRDGWQDVSMVVIFAPSTGSSTGGIFYDGLNIRDLIKNHPKDVKNALLRYAGKHQRAYEKEVKDWFKKKPDSLLDLMFGWDERNEWEISKKFKLGTLKYGEPVTRFQAVSIPIEVKVDFAVKKKKAVTSKPFDDMHNAELDAVIWANEGPEGVYMDGELTTTLTTRMRELRKRYRAMKPREQMRIFNAYDERARRGAVDTPPGRY